MTEPLDTSSRPVAEINGRQFLRAIRDALAGITLVVAVVVLGLLVLAVMAAVVATGGGLFVGLLNQPIALKIVGALVGLVVAAVAFVLLGDAADACLTTLGIRLNRPVVAVCWLLGPGIVVVCGPIVLLSHLGKGSQRKTGTALAGLALLAAFVAAGALAVG